MIFAPVRLGETSLNAEAVAADKKSCKRFGPCGVGKEALFLNPRHLPQLLLYTPSLKFT